MRLSRVATTGRLQTRAASWMQTRGGGERAAQPSMPWDPAGRACRSSTPFGWATPRRASAALTSRFSRRSAASGISPATPPTSGCQNPARCTARAASSSTPRRVWPTSRRTRGLRARHGSAHLRPRQLRRARVALGRRAEPSSTQRAVEGCRVRLGLRHAVVRLRLHVVSGDRADDLVYHVAAPCRATLPARRAAPPTGRCRPWARPSRCTERPGCAWTSRAPHCGRQRGVHGAEHCPHRQRAAWPAGERQAARVWPLEFLYSHVILRTAVAIEQRAPVQRP